MKLRLRELLAVALGLGLAVTIGVLARDMTRSLSERAEANQWVQHTLEVLAASERARAELIQLRGSTPDERRRHLAEAAVEVERIQSLTADNPMQVRNAAALRRLLEAAEADPAAPLQGLTMLTGDIRAEELRLLKLRTDKRTAAYRESQDALIRLTGAAVALLILSFLAAQAALRARERARLQDSMRDILEQQVAERTAELHAANAKLIEEARVREAAEAQLRQAQKLGSIGLLTGGIAHDFNNMLAIISGGLELARRRLDRGDPVKAADFLRTADEGVQRAAQLTRRLLAFARRQPLAPEVTDINALVASMSELLRRTLSGEIQLETVLAGGLWRAFVDRSELESAILNLAVNARDAMPEGGKLTIETANTHLDEAYASSHVEVRPGQYVVICVTDTGTGMEPEVVERAFDPFFTTKDSGKGTGLGLSQVFGFSKQSGGHVKIYSEMGVGTIVKLYLPRHLGEGEVAAPRRTVEPGRAKPGETVLLVEDEARVRELSADALRELGYSVLTAESGEQALGVLESEARVDLLFTDVVMPRMSGAELARKAATLRPALPILFTTAYTRNGIVHNGMLDPQVQMIGKPYGIRQLATKLREVLDPPEG